MPEIGYDNARIEALRRSWGTAHMPPQPELRPEFNHADYNLLFRWFVGLDVERKPWD